MDNHKCDCCSNELECEEIIPEVMEPEVIEISDNKIEELRAENARLLEQIKRMQADFENYRRNQQLHQEDLRKNANERLIFEMLPVIDNLERALLFTDNKNYLESLKTGVQMVLMQFKNILSEFGLNTVKSVGETFDPKLHECLETHETCECPEDTILNEYLKGYKIFDKLLRPAKVKVAKNPKKEDDLEGEEAEDNIEIQE